MEMRKLQMLNKLTDLEVTELPGVTVDETALRILRR
jgi:hypothetical protein